MKKILITGANSYIGTTFESYMAKFADEYTVDTVDMIDGSWREKSFAEYDVVFHVAGIAHSDNGKISAEKEKLYYAVNTDLTVETAKKAKADGVKQFIFSREGVIRLHLHLPGRDGQLGAHHHTHMLHRAHGDHRGHLPGHLGQSYGRDTEQQGHNGQEQYPHQQQPGDPLLIGQIKHQTAQQGHQVYKPTLTHRLSAVWAAARCAEFPGGCSARFDSGSALPPPAADGAR